MADFQDSGENKSIFNNYSSLYDTFYADKSYFKENEYICGLFSTENKPIHTILDLGCGTGGHDLLLAEQGYQVTGVDLSDGMVKQAIDKNTKAGLSAEFLVGDIRDVHLQRTFDLVISMFAVMSYQTSNAGFLAALTTARSHLAPGGLFIFDAWYGPAVLRELPETRVKEFDVEGQRIIRMAIPEIDTLNNKVIVHYKILRLSGSQVLEEIDEAHPMRYLFAPEVQLFAEKTGFTVQQVCPFLEPNRQPTEKDWNVTWVLKAV
jgi:SAM-dependent methyltransferase